MDAVTPREQQVFNAVMAAGMPRKRAFELAGRALGLTASSAARYFSLAKQKGAVLGGGPPRRKVSSKVARDRNPRRAADLVDLASEPAEGRGDHSTIDTLRLGEIAAKHKLPRRTVEELVRGVKRRYAPLIAEARNIKSDILRDRFASLTMEILKSISPGDLADANLRDKMGAADLAAKNWMLLDGRPTAIVRNDTDRESVLRLLAGVTIELERRGLKVEAPPALIELNPLPDRAPEPAAMTGAP